MFPYYHYTVDDGLPHSVVYRMLQDKKGFLWFTTDNGVSKYDGETFTNFSVVEGLLSNSVVPIAESSDGKIFVGVYGKGINYIQNNKVYLYHKNININSFMIERNGYLYVQSGFACVKINDTSSQFLWKPTGKSFGLYKTLQQDILVMKEGGGLYSMVNDTIVPYKNNILGNKEIFSLHQEEDSILWCGSIGKILKIQDTIVHEIVLPFKKKVYGIFIDSQKRIWFTIPNEGIFLLENEKITSIGKKLNIEKDNIGWPKEDKEGNIWITPYGKEVYCIYNTYITNYSTQDGLSHNYVKTITQDRYGRILIGTLNGITIIHNDSVTLPKNNYQNYEVRTIFTGLKDTIAIFGSASAIQNKKNLPYDSYTTYYYWPNLTSLAKINNTDTLLGGMWQNWIVFTNPQGNIIRYTQLYKNFSGYIRTKKLYKDVHNRIWIGTTSGLCQYVNTDSVYCYEGDTPLTGIIEDITEDSSQRVWVVSNKGVMYYKNNEWKNFILPEYTINAATSLQFDLKNHLWLGTSNGLYYYDGKTVKHFTKYSGLTSNNITTLYYEKEKNFLWIGTTEGLSRINITQYHSSIAKPLTPIISKVVVEDSTIYEPTSLQLSSIQNAVKIYFAGLHFQRPKSVIYEYRLNEDTLWRKTQSNIVELLNISYGTTQLFMRAKTENREWSTPITFLIEKETPFWATLPFYIFCGMIGITIIFVITERRIRSIKKREQEKTTLLNTMKKLEYQALAAMMNPHFIFNSLNAIQSLINNLEIRKANEYLTSFSQLIRSNLDVVEKNIISLHEELERLQLYLLLEKLRFGDSLEYIITVEKEIDLEETFIPNMLLQPFVENSLRHGILPSGRDGKISIIIKKENTIKIFIEDNGVGMKTTSFDYTSKGIRLIQERLQLLYKEQYTPILFHTLTDNSGNILGTRVEITLPDSAIL